MNRSTCHEFIENLDEYREGTLDPTQERILTTHLASCADCSRSLATLEAFGTAIHRAPLDPLMVRRLAVAASNPPRKAEKQSTIPTPLLSFAGAAAAAVVLVVAYGFPDDSQDRIHSPRPGFQNSVVLPPSTGQPPATADPLPAYTVRTAGDGRRYVEAIPGTTLWIDEETALHPVQLTPQKASFDLASGRVAVRIEKHKPGFVLVINTPSGATVEAKGTVFSVAVDPAGEQIVRVLEGVVEVTPPSAAPYSLARGQETVIGTGEISIAPHDRMAADHQLAYGTSGESDDPPDPAVTTVQGNGPGKQTPAGSVATAQSAIETGDLDGARDALTQLPEGPQRDKLMAALARAYRREQMYPAAAEVYGRIIAANPDGTAAAGAHVALGQLELDTLANPQSAANHFETYLHANGEGPLAETARAGLIRALQKANRYGPALEAINAYLGAYPGKRTAQMIRTRADILVSSGKCTEALDDYRKVQEAWPDSRESQLATQGAAKCTQPVVQ